MDRPLHTDDVVALKLDPTKRGLVERTHTDVDSHLPDPRRDEGYRLLRDKNIPKTAFRKFLRDGVPPNGSVLVRWDAGPSAELIPEHAVDLLDRTFLIGDVVRRTARDAMSGVVINTFTSCTLQPLGDVTYRGKHRLKGLVPSPLWDGFSQSDEDRPAPIIGVPACELAYAESPVEEDLVVFKDWIGRVELVHRNIVLKLTDNCVVEIKDKLAERADGLDGPFDVGDVAVTVKRHLRHGTWIFGQYNPNTPPVGTVVLNRHISVEVTWIQRRIGSTNENEPPALLERDEIESEDFHVYDRARRAWGHTEPFESVSNSEMDVRLALTVRFRDLEAAYARYTDSTTGGRLPRFDRKESLGYDLNVFGVIAYNTEVTIQWQDLTLTREASVDLVPDSVVEDEHAAWPGEIAHTVDVAPFADLPGVLQPSKVGVIQSVNAAERMARVRWSPASCVQYSDDETGTRSLIHGAVGKAEGTPDEMSLYDITTPAALNVRRGDIVLIRHVGDPTSIESNPRRWLGEVVDTCLDGTLLVRLGAARNVEDVSLLREECFVAVRSDGTDDIDNGDAMEDITNSATMSDDENDVDDSDDDLDVDTDDDDDAEPVASYEDEHGQPLDEDEVENEEWESDDGADTEMPDAFQGTPPTPLSAMPPEAVLVGADSVLAEKSDPAEWQYPAAYLILDAAVPVSHHFANEPSTDLPLHMKRTQREHKIIRSSLPKGVFVRSWESRLDLLRVLFIGPQDTPYQDAPFVVDIYLPRHFPTEPPEAYFHSWNAASNLGGASRVNPNLYEDGKICLSLLGTWEGEKGEGWNASRSTLLQVIVSILGLVLVKEPYFNEAGFEHLAGMEAYKRPSALYSERAYLRARAFVFIAIGSIRDGGQLAGLQGFEDEIKSLYTDHQGPMLLRKVITGIEAVLRHSENTDVEPDGMTMMSKGACIPLRRVLEKLLQLL